MRNEFRQLYQPRSYRRSEWLRRVWSWFWAVKTGRTCTNALMVWEVLLRKAPGTNRFWTPPTRCAVS